MHKCLNFSHCSQFSTSYQVLLPSIVNFDELFEPASDLWSWFILTKNNLLLTGRADGGDEKWRNGVSFKSFFALKQKFHCVFAYWWYIASSQCLLFSCHTKCCSLSLTRQLSSVRFFLSLHLPLLPSAYYCSAFMLHSGTAGAVVTNICTCGASNTSRKTPTRLPVIRY